MNFWSFFVKISLLNIEIFKCVSVFVGGSDVQIISQSLFFQIFFSQIFKVSFGERNGWGYLNLWSFYGALDGLA